MSHAASVSFRSSACKWATERRREVVMARVVFCELPSGSHWPGVAQLVSRVVEQGNLTVIVETPADARQLSQALWGLPPSVLVPHGIEGMDADDDVDPVVISVGASGSCRPLVVHAAPTQSSLATGDLVVEAVPQDPRLREVSRARFKSYRAQGKSPEFLSWDTWTKGALLRKS